MSATEDPRITFLRGAATACARGVSPEAWDTFALVLVHPSAPVIHRHVIEQGGDVVPNSGGIAILLGEISKLQGLGIPAGDGRAYALLCAGPGPYPCEPIELLDDEAAVRIGRSVLGGVRR